MKYLILILLAVFFLACKQKGYLIESTGVHKDNGAFTLSLNGGAYGYLAEPQIFSMRKDTFYMTGFIYESVVRTSTKHDSLFSGASDVNIYLGEIVDSMHIYRIHNCKLIGKSDCIGKFTVSFKPSKNTYIIYSKDNSGYDVCNNTSSLVKLYSILYKMNEPLYKIPNNICK